MNYLCRNKTTGEIREFEELEKDISEYMYQVYYRDTRTLENYSYDNFLSEWEVISDTPDVSKDTSSIDEPKEKCCDKCSAYFEHRIGSHSDDFGGTSDEPCYCNRDDCRKKDCKCHTPSSSLEDKIVEEFNKKIGLYSNLKFEIGRIRMAGGIDFEDWLKSQLSFYRQHLLQEYDNKFRMGYEAGVSIQIDWDSLLKDEQLKLLNLNNK